MWKTPVSAKVRHLLWLILHHAIPTNMMRHNRGMSLVGTCQRCSGSVEDILHCLRDCPHSREVWMRLGFWVHPTFFRIHDVKQWIQTFANGDMAVLFMAGVWWSWCWRNNMVLGDGSWSINDVTHKILLSHDEFLSFLVLEKNRGMQRSQLARWSAPLNDAVKLNVDGSFLESSSSIGSDGIMQNALGDWLTGFSCNDGVGDVLLAELLAIKHGLEFAWDLGFRMECETDSLEAVSIIQNNNWTQFHVHAAIIMHILELLDRTWVVKLTHIYRNANSCADYLAKLGVKQVVDVKRWGDAPREMGSLLLADVLGLRLNI